MKSYVRGTLLFTLRIWKLFPCRRKLLSHILVQFAHELSTTMFVLIKKDYRKKIGRRNRSPRITVYILRHATHAISFTLSLFSCCSSNLSLIQLIGSTNLHPNNTQTQRRSMVANHATSFCRTEKVELICIISSIFSPPFRNLT